MTEPATDQNRTANEPHRSSTSNACGHTLNGETSDQPSFQTLTSIFWKRYECQCNADERCEFCGIAVAISEEKNIASTAAALSNQEVKTKRDYWASTSEEDEPEETQKKENGPTDPNKDWDPMSNLYNSVLNLELGGRIDTDEQVFKLHGIKIPEMNECPFDDGLGGCFKLRCFKTHRDPTEPQKSQVQAPIVEDPNGLPGFCFDDLPQKTRPKRGMVFFGYVTYALSPNEFFVLPEKNGDCECNPSGNPEFEYRYTGKFAHDEVHQSLKMLMNKRGPEIVQTLAYVSGEVVICSTPQYGFTRGVVLDDCDDFKEKVPVYLIDIGETVSLPYIALYTLPQCLTKTPPLVYKCKLFGVTPIGLRYSQQSKEFLSRLLVKNKPLVRIQIMERGSGLRPFVEHKPFVVDITVKFKNIHIRLADILEDFGLAVQFNLIKTRPALLNTGAIKMTEAILLGLTDSKSQEEVKESLTEDVANWEKWREEKSKPKVKAVAAADKRIREIQVKGLEGLVNKELREPNNASYSYAMETILKKMPFKVPDSIPDGGKAPVPPGEDAEEQNCRTPQGQTIFPK